MRDPDFTPPAPEFGERVRVSAKYLRTATGGVGKTIKKWLRWPVNPTREGLYIGYRTLADGHAKWFGEDEYGFVPERHFRAALVVFSERERPVLVPLDALEVL